MAIWTADRDTEPDAFVTTNKSDYCGRSFGTEVLARKLELIQKEAGDYDHKSEAYSDHKKIESHSLIAYRRSTVSKHQRPFYGVIQKVSEDRVRTCCQTF